MPIVNNPGYGFEPWGIGVYGSGDAFGPRVVSAVSLNGDQVEVTFCEDMENDAELIDPTNYTLYEVLGVPATTSLVEVNQLGTLGGVLSVIVTCSGTTLGGRYIMRVIGPTDMAGNQMDINYTDMEFFAYGSDVSFGVTTPTGNQILVDFDQDVLTEAQFTPGVQQAAAYAFEVVPPITYPIPITVQTVTHPYTGDASKVLLTVTGMTSLSYNLNISSATSIAYAGDALPSSSTQFQGIEVGVGNTQVVSGGVSLIKEIGDLYGWGFRDLTGKITPTASYRSDFVFDTSTTTYVPALYDARLGTFSFSDSSVQFHIDFIRTGGQDQIVLRSDAFTSSINAAWSGGVHTLTVLRNKKGDFLAILWDGVPVISEGFLNITEASTILGGGAGGQFVLDTTYRIAGFLIASLNTTSTSTIYSSTWNFLHNHILPFMGSGALASDAFLTDKGPLVKSWGDATPATKNDVHVYVNSVEVPVKEVNPYIGKIVLDTPIPLMPMGGITVTVSYQWMCNPIFEMAGLNTQGLILNKWDLSGSLAPTSGERFSYNVALNSVQRPKPKWIGHKWIGFEQAYTATLNDATALLLNQNPHAVAVTPFSREILPSQVSYEGVITPLSADPIWEVEGVDTGGVRDDLETYLLKDASSGSYGVGTSAYYYRTEDLSFPSTLNIATRLFVQQYTLEGVFSGVGFGVHDNRRLYLVGLLEINGLKHVGVLKNSSEYFDQSAWEVAASVGVEIISPTEFLIPVNQLPTNFREGVKFQIFTGNQAGVYALETFIEVDDNNWKGVLAAGYTFPANYKLFGNRDVTLSFEIIWFEEPSSYRLVIEKDTKKVQLYSGGAFSQKILDTTGDATDFAFPVETNLQLFTSPKGQIFWGSLSREATNETVWSFYRYSLVPKQLVETDRGIVVSSEMSVLPEDDTNSEWFVTQNFGISQVDSTGQQILLQSLCESTSLDLTFGYARVEPFLTKRANVDVDVTYQIEHSTLGYEHSVRINDTEKEVRLGNLLYIEDPFYVVYRRLISLPVLSLSGLTRPLADGWVTSAVNTLSDVVVEQQVQVTQTVGEYGGYLKYLDVSGLTVPDTGSRVFGARIKISSYTANATGRVGVVFGCEAGFTNPRRVAVSFLAPVGVNPARVAFTDLPPSFVFASSIQEFPFVWNDGAYHTYKVVVSETSNAVSLVIDGVLQVPTANFTAFPLTTSLTNTETFFGSFGLDIASVAFWEEFYDSFEAPLNAKRTLGIWLGGDAKDINSWEVPRTDTTTAQNSHIAAVVTEMDWRNFIDVRVRRDKDWGVTVFRPDLPLPPYYTGQFATEITEPSAGWINVEYQLLPRQLQTFGEVSYGALEKASVSLQRWSSVRYRIYEYPSENFISPHHMVLNQYHVISSPEILGDTTPEVLQISVWNTKTLFFQPTQIFASRVFKVIDGAINYTEESWSFDPLLQKLTMLLDIEFQNSVVTVVFAPGKPVTETYLKAQPFYDTATLLNEGVPPFESDLSDLPQQQVLFGSILNDPDDILNSNPDFILNNSYKSVSFTQTDKDIYESLQFFTSDDGGEDGVLSTFCDTTCSGNGLIEVMLSGDAYTEHFAALQSPPFFSSGVLLASGGSFPATGGLLGPLAAGSEIMWPNAPGTTPPTLGQMGMNQQVRMILIQGGVIIDRRDF